MELLRIHTLESLDWIPILTASRTERLQLVQRLLDDFNSNLNRFDKAGELLLVQVERKVVTGVCGLNREPEVSLQRSGRVRRLYIDPAYRNRGLASGLIERIILLGRDYFSSLTVNCGSLPVGPFYERFGFFPIEAPGITHMLALE
ncbi:GNAT family N-acetyltransferase [bacterium]|nr:GNAT family N-acetyltransferase [bacterium]